MKPSWMNRTALGASLGCGLFVLAALVFQVTSNDSASCIPGASGPEVLLFYVPALIYTSALGVASYRVRPLPKHPRLFHLLFAPVPALCLCLAVCAALGLAAVGFGRPEAGLRASLGSIFTSISFLGVATAWLWSLPLLKFARHAGVLVAVEAAGAAVIAVHIALFLYSMSHGGI